MFFFVLFEICATDSRIQYSLRGKIPLLMLELPEGEGGARGRALVSVTLVFLETVA